MVAIVAKMTGRAKKTETFTTRLEPKEKYSLELLSRVTRRSIAKTLEDAIQQQIKHTHVELSGLPDEEQTLDAVIHSVWAPQEWLRLINLAGVAPQLLTYQEECKLALLTRKPICPMAVRTNIGGLKEIEINVRLAELAWPLIEELSEKMSGGMRAPPPTLKQIEEHYGEKIETSDEDLLFKSFRWAPEVV